MARAIDVANHLLHLASAEDERELMSHMRLQKLLYYVQGWSLALRGEPVFPTRIEAWSHGPVVKELYSQFKTYGDGAISILDEFGTGMSNDEMEITKSVWDAYKQYSAYSLRAMTHKEPPWINARHGYGPADRCSSEITTDAMKAYFSQRANE